MIEIEPSWCAVAAVVIYLAGLLVQKGLHRLGNIRLDTPSSRAVANFGVITVAVFCSAMLLLLALPETTSLHFINYPESMQDIQPPEKLFKVTQEYGKTIAQTNRVVHWFIFLLAIWLGNVAGLTYKILNERIAATDQEKRTLKDS